MCLVAPALIQKPFSGRSLATTVREGPWTVDEHDCLRGGMIDHPVRELVEPGAGNREGGMNSPTLITLGPVSFEFA